MSGVHERRCHECGETLGEHEWSLCCRCRSDPFPQDTKLRRRGFRVRGRPRGGPTTWEREGKVMTQEQAVLRCRDELLSLQTSHA